MLDVWEELHSDSERGGQLLGVDSVSLSPVTGPARLWQVCETQQL